MMPGLKSRVNVTWGLRSGTMCVATMTITRRSHFDVCRRCVAHAAKRHSLSACASAYRSKPTPEFLPSVAFGAVHAQLLASEGHAEPPRISARSRHPSVRLLSDTHFTGTRNLPAGYQADLRNFCDIGTKHPNPLLGRCLARSCASLRGNAAYVGCNDGSDGHPLANGRLQDYEATLEGHVHLGHGLFHRCV